MARDANVMTTYHREITVLQGFVGLPDAYAQLRMAREKEGI